MCQLLAHLDNPAIRVNLIPFILTYFQPCFHLFFWIGRDDHEKGIGNIVRPCTISVTQIIIKIMDRKGLTQS